MVWVSIKKRGGYPVLVSKKGGIPSLLDNDYIFNMESYQVSLRFQAVTIVQERGNRNNTQKKGVELSGNMC